MAKQRARQLKSGGRFCMTFRRPLGAVEGGSVDLSPFPVTTVKAVLTDFSPFCYLCKDILPRGVQEQVKIVPGSKGLILLSCL